MSNTKQSNISFVIFAVVFFNSVKTEDQDAVDPDKIDSNKLWQPTNSLSREEWIRCRGMSCPRWEVRQLKLMELQRLNNKNNGDDLENGGTDKGHPELMSHLAVQNVQQDDDVMLTEQQIDEALEQEQIKMYGSKQKQQNSRKMQNKQTYGRKRRKINAGVKRIDWDFPVVWKFGGDHTSREQETIKRAIKNWEENTCLRFQQIPTNQQHSTNHVIFTRNHLGCFSWLGKQVKIPQEVNLAKWCFDFDIGIPVHEIGHTLGLTHEQQRADRDDYVKILYENLGNFKTQFTKQNTVSTVPYDFSSIMHYSKRIGSINRGPTIKPLEKYKNYMHWTMGQRVAMTFLDAKLINVLPPCNKICIGVPLSGVCQRGGYQDPNDCKKCRCPPGFTGTYCESISGSINATCGGSYNLIPGAEMVIRSPGYPKLYDNFVECNWYLRTQIGYSMSVEFNGTFFLQSRDDSCIHYVEIVTSSNLDYPGPRLCGWGLPPGQYISDSNEMLMLFRSSFLIHRTRSRKGFQAIVKVIKARSTIAPVTTTTSTTTTTLPRTTTLPPTTTTTTPTTTTTTTTTMASTTAYVNPGPVIPYSFYCGFEFGNHNPESCGMMQSKDDTFDWSPNKGGTKSVYTGPSRAHTGDWYIYIEASGRQMFDKARIELPSVDSYGNYCLTFAYNMYGFHIYKLNVFKKSVSDDGNMEKIWGKKKQQGKKWLFAKFQFTLAANDQIVFEGVRGRGYSGDISLDEIKLTSC